MTLRPQSPREPYTLDKWDIRFIQYFKSCDEIKPINLVRIWAERCAVSEYDLLMPHIAIYLAELIDKLGLTPPLDEIMIAFHPDNAWKTGCPDGVGESTRAVYVMASWLRLTEVKYLPGYPISSQHD